MPSNSNHPKGTGKDPFGGLASERKAPADRGPRAAETVDRLLEATKTVFLSRGFAGTTIDAITQIAGVSHASFYTYFPSKREALIALGSRSMEGAGSMLRDLRSLPVQPTIEDLAGFVRRFFSMLDETGAFSVAWSQAAHHDAELRALGVREHLRMSDRIGRALGDLRQAPFEDPVAQGFLLQCQLERAWSFCLLHDDPQLTERVQRELAENISAILAGR